MSIGVTVFGAEHLAATTRESDQSDFLLATGAPIHHALPLETVAGTLAHRLRRLQASFTRQIWIFRRRSGVRSKVNDNVADVSVVLQIRSTVICGGDIDRR
ncbi:hypothetical protein HanIR_Chr14g0713011 [Helianthus annuus]|nr:hypothetical protein HanIR_Chr14g0713011 [Helianthus annuus]